MAVEAKMVEASDCGSEETGSNPVYRPIPISLIDQYFTLNKIRMDIKRLETELEELRRLEKKYGPRIDEQLRSFSSARSEQSADNR